MPSSTTKKVLVRRMDGQMTAGYAAPATYLRAEGVEILTRDGQVALVPYSELKEVHFVREFDPQNGREEKKQFQSRPKMGGLWVRMRFCDDDVLDGILPNNLAILIEHGLTITPPDPYSNSQRIFVPRAAVREVTVLGVIGSPLAKPRRKRGAPEKRQIEMFEGES